MSIIETIEKANYVATEKQIEALAAAVSTGSRGSGTYLRILVAALQAELGGRPARRGRPRRAEPMDALERVHKRLYESVKRGCAGDDVNRRSTFARTSASTLRGWIARGGDPRSLTVATVTKRSLAAAKASPDERFADRLAKLVRAAERLGPSAIAQLAALGVASSAPQVVATKLTRVHAPH